MKTRWLKFLLAFVLLALSGGALLPAPGTGTRLASARSVLPTYPTANVEVQGHGFGHGRGMGQYGALGYALAGWSYPQILGHFYSNTTAGAIGNNPLTVRLTGYDGTTTTVVQELGEMVVSSPSIANPGPYPALRAVLVGPNAFQIQTGPGCAGPWTPVGGPTAGPVTFSPTNPPAVDNVDRHTQMLQTCFPGGGGTRWYRGAIEAVDSGGAGTVADQRTVNALTMEQYLPGSVPRESPASWGDLGSGAGEQALDAQAVAARSYAASSVNYPYANICDSTACQVYQGYAFQVNGSYTLLESPQSTAAVLNTAGQVRMLNGAVARTEYSSSTGGYTAGGTFPAVPDDGDATPSNPNHSWDVQIPVGAIQAAYGIGTLSLITVTSRNGLGDFGGRTLKVQISGTAGTVTDTGDGFAAKLGLRSNWFQIVYPGGYWVVGTDGGIYSFGNAAFFGSMGGSHLNQPIVGIVSTPSGQGYWMVAADGGIFRFGDAAFFGSTGGMHLNKPIVGMAATPSGQGYWLVASDGGIFAYGDAHFYGSMGGSHLNQPIVAISTSPTGLGYRMVAADGGIFSFGDAHFYGSMGGSHLNQPIVGMTSAVSGNGYWMVAADGGIFNFGPDAILYGSMGGSPLNSPMVGMAVTPTGQGYWLVAADGGIFNFGNAGLFGSVPGVVAHANAPIVGMASAPAHG